MRSLGCARYWLVKEFIYEGDQFAGRERFTPENNFQALIFLFRLGQAAEHQDGEEGRIGGYDRLAPDHSYQALRGR